MTNALKSYPAPLKSYPAPWNGRILLACRKCQRKLKKHDVLPVLAELKKTIKRSNKRKASDEQIHILNVPCMDLCPKNGVTVCDVTETPARLNILRNQAEIDRL